MDMIAVCGKGKKEKCNSKKSGNNENKYNIIGKGNYVNFIHYIFKFYFY